MAKGIIAPNQELQSVSIVSSIISLPWGHSEVRRIKHGSRGVEGFIGGFE